MKTVIINGMKVEEVNGNGIIYTKESIQKVIELFNSNVEKRNNVVYKSYNPTNWKEGSNIDDVFGFISNISLEDNIIKYTVEVIDEICDLESIQENYTIGATILALLENCKVVNIERFDTHFGLLHKSFNSFYGKQEYLEITLERKRKELYEVMKSMKTLEEEEYTENEPRMGGDGNYTEIPVLTANMEFFKRLEEFRSKQSEIQKEINELIEKQRSVESSNEKEESC